MASRSRRQPQRPSQAPRRRRQAQRLSQAQRRRRARKARAARRQLRHSYRHLPAQARSLFDALAPAFTRPTFLRFAVLALAALLTLGGRTVCNLLRTLGALAPGHPSSYHKVFSHRRWSGWRLARLLAGWVFTHLLPDGPIEVAGDDTATPSAPPTPTPPSAGGTSGS